MDPAFISVEGEAYRDFFMSLTAFKATTNALDRSHISVTLLWMRIEEDLEIVLFWLCVSMALGFNLLAENSDLKPKSPLLNPQAA